MKIFLIYISLLLCEEGATAEIGSYNQFIPRLLYLGK